MRNLACLSPRVLLITLLMVFLPLCVCAVHAQDTPSPSGLDMAGTVPLQGEALEDQVVFFFGEPIELSDDAREKPFTIEPQLTGTYLTGPNYVAFKAQTSFALVNRAPIYTVTLSEGIKGRESGRTLDAEQRVWIFAGVKFRPVDVRQVVPPEAVAQMPAFLLARFTMPVDAQAVKPYIEVSAAGNPIEFAASSIGLQEAPELVRLDVPNCPAGNVRVAFKEGLPDRSGQYELAKAVSFDVTVQETGPSKESTLSVNVQWGPFEPDGQEIVLSFSSSAEPRAIREHLSITDRESGASIPYEIQSTESDRSQTVAVHVDTSKTINLLIRLSKGLTAADGAQLTADYTANLFHMPRAVDIEYTGWQERGKDGLALALNFNKPLNVGQLGNHVVIDPPIENLRVEARYAQGFLVYGAWDSKRTYQVRVTSGLVDEEGVELSQDLVRQVRTEEVPSYIGFGFEDKVYFPQRTDGTIPIVSRNLEKASITLYRMFPNNIAVALSSARDENLYSFSSRWAEEMAQKEIALVHTPDRLAQTPLAVDDLFPADKRGVFCLEARTERGSARKLVLFTNIGLVSHWQNDELALFAHDLFTLAPLEVAKATIYSNKNQVLAQGNTDNLGLMRLGPFDAALGEPSVVVVEKEGDYTYIELVAEPMPPVELPDNAPGYNRTAYDAFLYADRDLYRPGETVHLRWIVRRNYGEPVANVPLIVTVIKPNGQKLLSKPVKLSELGAGGLDLSTEKVYPTGQYTVMLNVPGGEESIGSYQFSLEEFVPNRIETAVSVDAAYFAAGQDYTIHVHAKHLFGAPAASRRCEAEVLLMDDGIGLEGWKSYRFTNDAAFQPQTVPLGDAQTDQEGHAAFTFRYDPSLKANKPLKAVVIGRVFELGGRAVAGKAERTIFPSDVALGINARADTAAQRIVVDLAAVRPDGTASDLAAVKATLERQSWNYYVRRFYSHNEPNWTPTFDELETQDVPLTEGRGTATFTVPGYGYFRVRVHCEQTPQYASASFYSYGRHIQIAETAQPSLIKLTLDKDSYAAGEEASLRIESPFDGKALVIVQGDSIEYVTAADVVGGKTTVPLQVLEGYYPNVWAEVTVVHAVQENRKQMHPFSSFAMTPIRVKDDVRKLVATFPDLPVEVRPETQAAFELLLTDAAGRPIQGKLTLAAVDEGIHALSGYENPDPHGWLTRLRRPDYRRAEYYDKVAYDFDQPTIGGGIAAELLKRLGAEQETWIKTVALWSDVVNTGPDGRATVTMDIPEFSGTLRLVAAAWSDKALGSGAAKVFVRRKCGLRTNMPRFMLPGDTAQCRAVVFNNMEEPVKAAVSWTAGGALHEISGSAQLDVPAHSEADAPVELVAGPAAGQGEILWKAVFSGADGTVLETIEERAPLPVNTPAAFRSETELIVLKPGDVRTFTNTRFEENERFELSLTVSGQPQLQLYESLKYVMGYPYGCVEQATSRLLPMYLCRQSQDLTGKLLEQGQSPGAYIQTGIARLFAMQTPSGGLAAWPGGTTPYSYGSIYALHFLTLVKNDRAFQVPEYNFKALQDYVRGVMQDTTGPQREDVYWPSTDHSLNYQRAYAVYVLALDGDLEAIRNIERFDGVPVPKAARMMLAAALALNTKDRERVQTYLATAPCVPYDETTQGGVLNSAIRNTAVELLMLLQIEGAQAEQAEKARMLTDWLRKQSLWRTTQETAFVIAALSKYLETIQSNLDAAAATIETPEGQKTLKGNETLHVEGSGPGLRFAVNNTGQVDLYVNVAAQGIPSQVELSEVSEGMKLVRVMRSDMGAVYEPRSFDQGRSYIVDIELQCNANVENVVLVDLLPAGFEIENPRIDTTAMAASQLPGAEDPAHLDIRDDRVIAAFSYLRKGSHRFYYVVRAITPGTYQRPGAGAECMYEPRIRARTVPENVEVRTVQ